MTLNKEIECLICRKTSKQIFHKLEGYVPGIFYDIYNCSECDINFIDPNEIDNQIYEIIYKDPENIYGYDKYASYASVIKQQTKPLEWLAKKEEPYTCVNHFLQGKKGLNILEVGCGMGYMTYALNMEGNNAIGIDISEESIVFAKKTFGNHYFVDDIYNPVHIANHQFDYIVSTEVIEHMVDPLGYIESMRSLLSSNGQIIITTPNKGYLKKNKAIWWGDLPPVHISFLSFQSIKSIARICHMDVKAFDYLKNSNTYNNFVRYIFSQYISNGNARPHYGRHHGNIIFKYIFKLMNLGPIKSICNRCFKYIASSENDFWNLGIILTKK